jgi:cytochrome c553
VKQPVSVVALCVACLLLGAALQKYYDSHRYAGPATADMRKPQPDTGPAVDNTLPPRISVDLAAEPLFAYGFNTPAAPGDKAAPQNPPNRNLRKNEDPVEQTRPRRIDGSAASYSLVDVRDGANVIDWFPDEHPPMSDVIAHGPVRAAEAKRGCGSCHLPNGQGRPENAPVAGLPVTYIVRQINDFRQGLRYTADPRKPNTNTMIQLAKAMTDEELKSAAEYFSSLKWRPWTRVVETTTVPKTKIEGNLFIATEQARTEPIAGRIIEVPEDASQTETVRNPHVGFVAYVPVGSVKKGKDFVTTGGMRIVGNEIVQGKTTACTTCHGLDLMGVADVPPIAGRSASYIVRQIYDMQKGTRNGQSAQLMKMAISRLDKDDIVAIAAYVAGLVPPKASSNSKMTN